MTPQQLKASILKYAMQGKLVEQRAEEGAGEELYQQIQAEKQRLIKEGKIKKEKPLAEIIDDEIPFDIPESWKWCRITDCGVFISGYTPKPTDLTSEGAVPYFKVSDMNTEGNELFLNYTENYLKSSNPKCFLKNTIVYPKNGGAVFTNKKRILSKNSVVDLNTGGYYPIEPIDLMFVYIFFSNIDFRKCYKGTALPTIDMDRLKSKLFPLPPLAEQKRIVAKIEELLPYVDRYAAAYEKLEQFNAKFPEDMKKSILQYAIQGKLVEQRPEEGTGEELYRQIQTEKQRLIKEGKIKKEKPLPEIAEDEIPFDIPESWKWVRLSQIAILENGDRSGKYPVEKDYVDFGVPFFGAKDMCDAVMSFDNVRYISMEKFAELGNGKLQDKDFICLLRGSVGKCALFIADEQHHTGFICAQMVIIRCINTAICHYLASFLASPFYLRYIDSKVTGTAVRQLPAKELGNVLIPLPPLAEQNRIVAKLEEILPLYERLK